MSTEDTIVAEAMKLDEERRAAVALRLLDSLAAPDERDEQAWIDEIERRARRALSGRLDGPLVEDAIAEIERDLGL